MISPDCDESLLQNLPLPLAQLYRRAHNAKSPHELHNNAYYLWEAGLKLLASVAVVEYAQNPGDDPRLGERLRNLARPALGHWWEFVRLLVPVLAGRGIDGFTAARELVLGAARADLPRAAGLDAVLTELLDGKSTTRAGVRLTELVDRLVRHRNEELGHGAAGQRPAEHYDRLGRALLGSAAEVFRRLDPLAGGRLLYVAEVRQLGGVWLAQRFELIGESPRRIPSLELPWAEAARLPQGDRVYLERGEVLCSLHPLLIHDAEAGEVLFLNARRKQQRTEYLCYTTGRHVERADLGTEQRALLARVLKMPVAEEQAAAWAARSSAEEPGDVPALPSRDNAPRTLGDFELLSELGRGGMGVVYRAWQASLGRQVALKKLARTQDPKAEVRFAREIHALGRVEHPHLVKIFGSGADGDQWFYAMELVEGTPLSSVCEHLQTRTSSAAGLDLDTWRGVVNTACAEARKEEKPLSDSSMRVPPQRPASAPASVGGQALVRGGKSYVGHIVELIRQVADAAQALHEARVLHRDIKPGNIMVTEDGSKAVLMDLGLAQLMDDAEGRLTRTRQFVGTLRYASPQQVLAVGKLDARTDVYSLGASLWELLTLRPLFGATEETPTPVLMEKIQREEPERLRKYHPGLSRDLEAIVFKCLEKDADRRYASAAELSRDLRRFLDGEPVRARPVSSLERTWKWAKRRPALAGLIAVIVLATVGLLGGGAWFTWQLTEHGEALEKANRDLSEREARLHTALIKQRELRAEADQKRRDAESQEKEALKKKTEADKARKEAEEQKNAARKAEEKAREATARLVPISLEAAENAWDLGRMEEAQAWLNDIPPEFRNWGWHYLQRKFRGGYCTLYGHTQEVTSVAFSPDGTLLASGSRDGTVMVWNGATGRHLRTLAGRDGNVASLAFSMDNHTLAVVCNDEIVKLWDAGDGKELHTLHVKDLLGPFQTRDLRISTAVFSKDDRYLAVNVGDLIALWDMRKWRGGLAERRGKQRKDVEPLKPLMSHGKLVSTLAFGPNGKVVVSGGEGSTIKVWDAETNEELYSLYGHAGDVTSLSVSDDNRLAASGSRDGTARVWDLAARREAHTIPVSSDVEITVSFSPDGRHLAVGGGQSLEIWDARTGRKSQTLRGPKRRMTALAFSPDAQRLVGANADGTIVLWNIGAQAQQFVDQENRPRTQVTLSPDGRRLACVRLPRNDGLAPHEIRGRGPTELWDLTTGTRIATLAECEIGLSYSADGRFLAITNRERVAICNAQTGREVGPPLFRNARNSGACVFAPDGHTLACGSEHGLVRLEDLLQPAKSRTLKGQQGAISSLAFSSDGKQLASGTYDGAVKVWTVSSGHVSFSLPERKEAVHRLLLSPDGECLMVGWHDGIVTLFDLQSRSEIQTLRGQNRILACSPSGMLLTHWDDRIRFWDARMGQELFSLRGQADTVAFGSDDRVLTTAYGLSVRRWDARLDSFLRASVSHGADITHLAFSPTEPILATAADDSTVRLWNAHSGKELHRLFIDRLGTRYLSFSRDGRCLATIGLDRSVRIWNVETGKELLSPLTHPDVVTCVAFSSDGRQLATGAGDLKVRLFDARTGKYVAALGKHDNVVTGLAFSPDGKFLASADWNGAVTLWSLNTQREVSSLHADAGETTVQFSDDGNTLFVRNRAGNLTTWDVRKPPRRPIDFNRQARNVLKAMEVDRLPVRSPRERLLARPSGRHVELIDLARTDEMEWALREGQARFDQSWHDTRAVEYAGASDWHAASFHYARLAEMLPEVDKYWRELTSLSTHMGVSPGLTVCSRLLSRHPHLAPLYARRAALHVGLFQFDAALADQLAGLALAAANPVGWPEFAASAHDWGMVSARSAHLDPVDWSVACRQFSLAALWEPQDPWHQHRLAWAELAAGRTDAFQATCRRLFANYQTTLDVEERFRLSAALTSGLSLGAAWQRCLGQPGVDGILLSMRTRRHDAIVYTACIVRDHGLPVDELVKLAQQTVETQRTADYLETLGAAQYRARRFKHAVDTLENAVKLNGKGGSDWMKLFLAMAYHEHGEKKKAREWFDRARPDHHGWEQRLVFQTLRAEAARLLKIEPASSR